MHIRTHMGERPYHNDEKNRIRRERRKLLKEETIRQMIQPKKLIDIQDQSDIRISNLIEDGKDKNTSNTHFEIL